MFDTSTIKKSMEIVGADGVSVGTVDAVVGDHLNLTRVDTGQRPHPERQHYLPTRLVSSVDGGKVRLSANGNVATQFVEISTPVQADRSPRAGASRSPFWNWNRIGVGAGIAAMGAAGALILNRKSPAADDFEYRLETDENVRLISSDKVTDTPVVGRNGEVLGHIKSFMVDKYSGRVAYAVMAFGGTMGFGKALFPLPWPLLDYDVEKDGYALDITKAQLAKAPRFEESEKVEFTPEYRRKLILFYR
jgi:hypothetical protein